MFGRQMVTGIAGRHMTKMLGRLMANRFSKNREKADSRIILLLCRDLVEI